MGLRGQIYLGLFFILFISNTIVCHYAGTGHVRAAQTMAAHRDDASFVAPESDLSELQKSFGRLMVIMNFPLFMVVGFIVRSPDPGMGFGYWLALIIGSVYLPGIMTMLVYFLIHPPERLQPPGVAEPDIFEDDDE